MEVVFPVELITPVRFAFVVTVLAFPVIDPEGKTKSVPAVAAEIAVPLPFKSPVMLVVMVIAGVVVSVATVPVKPFADTTLALVTVPPLPVALIVNDG